MSELKCSIFIVVLSDSCKSIIIYKRSVTIFRKLIAISGKLIAIFEKCLFLSLLKTFQKCHVIGNFAIYINIIFIVCHVIARNEEIASSFVLRCRNDGKARLLPVSYLRCRNDVKGGNIFIPRTQKYIHYKYKQSVCVKLCPCSLHC